MGGELRDEGHGAIHPGDNGAAAGIHVTLQKAEEHRQGVLLRLSRSGDRR
jgi:hypothetical protein